MDGPEDVGFAAADGAAEMRVVALGRSDGPPLRFRGRLICRVAGALPGGRLELALWHRDPEGFALSASHRSGCGAATASWAALAGSREAAARALEAAPLLADLAHARPSRAARGGAACAARLSRAARLAALAQLHADLAGEVLAALYAPLGSRSPNRKALSHSVAQQAEASTEGPAHGASKARR